MCYFAALGLLVGRLLLPSSWKFLLWVNPLAPAGTPEKGTGIDRLPKPLLYVRHRQFGGGRHTRGFMDPSGNCVNFPNSPHQEVHTSEPILQSSNQSQLQRFERRKEGSMRELGGVGRRDEF